MVQILSYTRRPTDKSRTVFKTHANEFFKSLTEVNKTCLRTKGVEDICDENKLAGVELDHRGVRQKLRALEHTSYMNANIIQEKTR